jgi:phosphate starvation-inducible protein PhoH and related proteins|tara:strand:- start:16910 stop:17656 length:747 start_codon:yes stop_codon:yes gene_type:complete
MSRKKRKEREFKTQIRESHNLKIIKGGQVEIISRATQVNIVPRNFKQDDLLESLTNPNINIVFTTGPAGTGKTLISTLYAIREFRAGRVDKIVITRPAVSVDEQHGFLPGTLVEKMAPWTRPIFDIFDQFYHPKEMEYLVENNKIEVAPLAYMRGRTFKDSIILADEMQNATAEQMKMLLTRIGDNSKLIVTGDLNQHDRGYSDNGLKDFLDRIRNVTSERISLVEFDHTQIERHPAVAEVLKIYKAY